MEALRNYDGTILIISHDREFLDGIVNKIIEVKDKNIKTYLGNCTYYLQKKEEERSGILAGKIDKKDIQSNGSVGINSGKKTKGQKRLEAEARNKLYKSSKPLKDKIHKLEKGVKEAEEKLKKIESEMTLPDFYNDPKNSSKVTAEYKKAKSALELVFNEWERESAKLSKIEGVTIK
jgi:ATP-binding cassette subfamily F protein 3